MRINPMQVLYSLDGTPILDDTGNPVTIRDAIFIAINNLPRDAVTTAELKSRIYQVELKVYSGKREVALTAEQVNLIKERAGMVLSPLLYGRLCQAVDPDSFPEETGEEGPDSSNSES